MGRLDTGIPGLDTLLNGGLFKGGVYIVEGAPGSGKTILGNQICFHRAAAGDSTIYITLLAESHTRMISHLRGMDFFRPELIASAIYYISAFKVLEETGLDGLLKSIREAVHTRKASFVVLDGLVSAEEFSPSARAFKKFIHEVQTVSGMTGCTVLLLSSTERAGGFRPEHTMVDGLIELGDTAVGVQSLRHAVVRKMRGTRQLRGRHALEISSAGIKIRPRIESLLYMSEEDPAPRQIARTRSCSARRAAARPCSGCSSCRRALATIRSACTSGSTSGRPACSPRVTASASASMRRASAASSTCCGRRRSRACSTPWSSACCARWPSIASTGCASTASTGFATTPSTPSGRVRCSPPSPTS
jgi:KaiC/GvpD/RAD55 family RecA-like ATPase